jgi:hypothetical protein
MPGRNRAGSRYGAEGAVWRRIVRAVVSRDRGICHVCRHPGAKAADHLVPVTERPDLALDAANLKAVHAVPAGCPVCSAAALARGGKPVYCNEVKGAMSLDRARRIIETRTGLSLGPKTAEQPPGERDWLPPLPRQHQAQPPRAFVPVVAQPVRRSQVARQVVPAQSARYDVVYARCPRVVHVPPQPRVDFPSVRAQALRHPAPPAVPPVDRSVGVPVPAHGYFSFGFLEQP